MNNPFTQGNFILLEKNCKSNNYGYIMNFTIFGAGAWGTAIAIHIERLNHTVTLVPRRLEHAQALGSSRENKDYLAGFSLPDSIQITSNVKSALENTDVALLACPSVGLRTLCSAIKENLENKHSVKAFVTLCKGLEISTLLPPASVVKDVFPNSVCGVLSGPTFAGEVALGKPTAITLAMTPEDEISIAIQSALSNSQLRVYRSVDLIGVEYAGCLKNIYAIGAGICDGLQLGDNAKASYLTRSLHELVKIGTALGGQSQTFYGLSGFGDLVATCFGPWSRNRTFGQKVAEGNSPQSILDSQKTVVEGYWATDCFHKLLSQKHLECPILNEIHCVLYSNKSPKEALNSLMNRSLKTES